MRIDHLPPSEVKGRGTARVSSGSRWQPTAATGSTKESDGVSLSNLALLASGGAPPERIEQLHDAVSRRSYLVPALAVSRRIVDYSLAG